MGRFYVLSGCLPKGPGEGVVGLFGEKVNLMGAEARRTLELGAPLAAAQLLQLSMTFIDTVMVGRLGSSELAAAALGNAVFSPFLITLMGALSATSPMVAQAWGAGRLESVTRSVRQGLWLASLLTILALVVFAAAPAALLWMGQDRATVDNMSSYLRALCFGVPAFLGFSVLRNLVEGLSQPRIVTLITLGGTLLNIGLNYILMFGKLGFPALGLLGCGIATSIVHWVHFVCLSWYVTRSADFSRFRIFSRLGQPDWDYFRELVRIGWPIAGSQGLEAGLFAATAFLMGLIAVPVLAAHMIALECAAMTFMVPLGLSIATAVRVGQAVGRGDLEGAERAGWIGVLLGGAFMSLAAFCFLVFPETIISLFLDTGLAENQEVVEIAAGLLAVAGLFQMFDGIQVTAMGALRGLKDTMLPMGIALLSYWLVGLPVGVWLAFRLNWGGQGLWSGLVVGLATAAVLLGLRFRWQIRAVRRQGQLSGKVDRPAF